MGHDEALRDQLRDLISRGNAHIDFERAVADLPAELRGARHPSVPHSPWQMVEHMRIVQWDILRFCVDPDHDSPEFPEGYWPKGEAQPDADAWDRTVEGFLADRQAMIDLVMDPKTDLNSRLPHGDGQTILREALLVADHNAYHLGQLIIVRRLVGAWNE